MNRPDPDTTPHRVPSAEVPAQPEGWRETRDMFEGWYRQAHQAEHGYTPAPIEPDPEH